MSDTHQHERAAQQLGCRAYLDETVRIAGIEQEGAYVGVGEAVAVAQLGHVEQQLHVVLLLLARRVRVGPGREGSLAGLLLDEYAAARAADIHLEQVHAPLQAERLAEERGLEHGLCGAEIAHLGRQDGTHGAADVGQLGLRLGVERAVDAVGGGKREGVAAEKAGHRVGIADVKPVDGLVEKLPGEVAQQRVHGVRGGLYLVEQVC